MRDIQLQVQWTEEDMLNAFEQHWKIGFSKVSHVIMQVLGLIIIVIALYSLFTKGVYWVPVILLTLGLYFTLFRQWTRRGLVRLRTRRSPLYGKTISMTFSDKGIRSRIEGMYDTTVNWDYYQKAMVTPDGILLYQNAQAFIYISRNAFNDETQYLQLLDALQKNIMEFRELEA